MSMFDEKRGCSVKTLYLLGLILKFYFQLLYNEHEVHNHSVVVAVIAVVPRPEASVQVLTFHLQI